MNIFEQATRQALRFSSPKGLLTVEDLWALPLTSSTGKANLDDIAKELFTQLKNETNISFVKKAATADEKVQLSFDIVKHIIEVRVAESEAAAVARGNAEKKQRLLAVLEQKENDQLGSLSIDELRAQINAL